jgi:hypothetical protein
MLPSTFDNATKLLNVTDQSHIGVITYGVGAIGQQEPRTPHSFLPELQDVLSDRKVGRLPVEGFARTLGSFFMEQWSKRMSKEYSGPEMVFLVGGFNEGEPYGRVFQVSLPSNPAPQEQNAGRFGITWGGQLEYTTRLIKGFDPQLPSIAQRHLALTDDQREALRDHLEGMLSLRIPYQFLPLQDCVDLAIFLIRTTIDIQTWTLGVRGVGGAIDVATITRTEGFMSVQQKKVVGRGAAR